MGSDAEFSDDWFGADYPNDNSTFNYTPTIENQNEMGISAATNLMNADDMDFVVPLNDYQHQQSYIQPPYNHSNPNDQTCQYFWPSAMPLHETQNLQTDVANSYLVAATNRVAPCGSSMNPRLYGHNVDGNFYSYPYYSFEHPQSLVVPMHPFNNSDMVPPMNISYDQSATMIAANESAKQSEIEQTSEVVDVSKRRGRPRGCKNVEKFSMAIKRNSKGHALKRKKKPDGPVVTFKESSEQYELLEATERFRLRRIELNVSQYQLSISLIPLFGVHLSQTTISRYENSRLSFENLKKLRDVLDAWMRKADEALADGKTVEEFVNESMEMLPNQSGCLKMDESLEPSSEVEDTLDSVSFAFTKRRKRTRLSEEQLNSMVAEFDFHPKPNNVRIAELAKSLGLLPSVSSQQQNNRDCELWVVKIWFANRRSSIKKKKQRDDEDDIVEQSLKSCNDCPSSSGLQR